ncbi:beta-lactamase family protein [Flavobacteriaceae bacterium TK19130]|nr:beta-lactamase family protein [Thermobacterium salinum]
MNFKYILLLFSTLLLFSCEEDNNDNVCDPSPQFNIEEFITQIETRLNSQTIIGYQFAVNQDGNYYDDQSMGLARHDFDPGGPVPITQSTRFNTASIAKFIAAIVLVNALEDNNISLDWDFIDYLPTSWHDKAHFQHQYTFRELLTHQTGIKFINPSGTSQSPGRVQSEAQMLEALMAPPDPGLIGEYQNGNFNLVRVLIGEIVYSLEVNEEGEYANNTVCTDKYFEYLEQKIIFPLSLTCPSSAEEVNSYYSSTPYPYAYQYPFDSTFVDATGSLGWAHSNNPYTTSGAAGLMLSAMEIAKIAANLKHDNTNLIISPSGRDDILEFELGLYNSLSGENGRYKCKRGTRGPDGSSTANPPTCCDRAIQSILMFFPNGVEAVIITNSRHNTMHTLLRDAYDASFVNPCI